MSAKKQRLKRRLEIETRAKDRARAEQRAAYLASEHAQASAVIAAKSFGQLETQHRYDPRREYAVTLYVSEMELRHTQSARNFDAAKAALGCSLAGRIIRSLEEALEGARP